MAKVRQTILFENDDLIFIELYGYPEVKTPLEAMKCLEEIEKAKETLISKYKFVEVISGKDSFHQIVRIETI